MRLLSRLAARDLRRHPVESLMVFLVIAAAAATLTIAFALSGVTAHPYQQTRAATAGPDVVADVFSGLPNPTGRQSTAPSGTSTPRSQSSERHATIASLVHAAGVTAHSGPYPSLYSTIGFAGRTADVVVEGRDQTLAPVDQPKLTRGRWVRPGGVVLERGFADALGVHVGDDLTLGGRTFRVAGIAVTAGVPVYPSSLCHLACLTAVPQTMGLAWIMRAAAARLAGRSTTTSYLLNLRLAHPSNAAAFVAARNGVSVGRSTAVLYTWQSIRDADTALIEVEQIALQFAGWLLALLALAGLAVLVGRRMTEQTRRVGLLKAVGATPGTVALVLLVEHLVLGAAAAAAGLAAGRLVAPLLASPGAGLVGAPGSPAMATSTLLLVTCVALGVAAVSSLLPAVRAGRMSTVAALADAPRPPRRRRIAVAWSTRLPVPLLLGVRQLARRPRRALLSGASIAVTVTGIVAILANAANTHAPGADAIVNLKIERLDQLMKVVTIMLVILAAVNTTFTAWATATDGRFSSALERALGATARQVTTGLSIAALLPALPAALIGVPLGIGVYDLIAQNQSLTVPPMWQLALVVVVSPLVVAILTGIPSRSEARHPPAEILQNQ
jgi:ABC-type lipoprotein release transport system permease subunit